MKINKDLNKYLKETKKDFKINFENIRKNIFLINNYILSMRITDEENEITIVSKELNNFQIGKDQKGSFFRFEFYGKTDESKILIIEVCGNFEVLISDLNLNFQNYNYPFLNALYCEVE